MKSRFYLLNVTMSGMKGIEKPITLEFYKKTVTKDFDPSKYRVKAIYGENGVGKSAIVQAVKLFHDIVLNPSYLQNDMEQHRLREYVNKKTKHFSYECEYWVDNSDEANVLTYRIQLEENLLGKYEITSEELYCRTAKYPKSTKEKIFEVKNGEIIYLNYEEIEQEEIKNKTMNLLSTTSFINVYNVKFIFGVDKIKGKLAEGCFDIFVSALFTSTYISEMDQHEMYFLRKKYSEMNQLIDKESFLNAQKDKIFGVNERAIPKSQYKYYEQMIKRLTRFLQIFKRELLDIEIEKRENGENYDCELNLVYKDYKINREFESTGIRKLIALYDSLYSASTGGIVFIDEMDANLNDIYFCKLIEYFMEYGEGQLCFTTHNIDPMSVLKKNKNSIDFLSSDNIIIPWTKNGNATPENSYKNGMIENIPFNVDATDFLGVLGE